jgi:hypothetical protein
MPSADNRIEDQTEVDSKGHVICLHVAASHDLGSGFSSKVSTVENITNIKSVILGFS